eukprot:TRINITY_DN32122_c0_g1_i2.p1 TRINITY_DN32122_c0_g1~~TRINITY_DN32122_c0_g1_i2.p1  ORF type:complete len:301 (+),score=43.70 TRINITY_DN32122_c0_g1_i2:42-905(+)
MTWFSAVHDFLESVGNILPGHSDASAEVVASCHYNSKRHGAIRVGIDGHNRRYLTFDNDPGWTEAVVPCSGPAPKRVQSNDCEDDEVRSKYGCSAASIDPGHVPAPLQRLAASCREKPQNVLFLGLGGGFYQTYLESRCPGSKIVTLEENANVINAAKDFFGFKGEVVGEGASTGLPRLVKEGRHFDAVVSDMGQHRMSKQDASDVAHLLGKQGTLHVEWCYDGRQQHLKDLQSFFGDVTEENDHECVWYAAQRAADAAVAAAAKAADAVDAAANLQGSNDNSLSTS